MKTLKLSSLFILLLSFGFTFQACDQMLPLTESEVNAYKATEASKAVDLVDGEWTDGVFSASKVSWFRFEVEKGALYSVAMNNIYDGDYSKDACSGMTAYKENLVDTYFIDYFSIYSPPCYLEAEEDGYVYLKIFETNANYNGSFAVKFEENESFALSSSAWTPGTISSYGIVKYYFNAQAGTSYYIYLDDAYSGSGTYSLDCTISVSNEDKSITYFSYVDSAYYTPITITATASERIYIEVEAYSSGNSGTFAIKYEEVP